MKLVSFIHDNQLKMGAIVNGTITIATGNMQHAESMITFLNGGDCALNTLQQLIENPKFHIPLASVILKTPIARPGKFLGIGLNYADHIGETGLEKPEFPTFFTKQSSCVIGPNQPIVCPNISDKIDYEGELAFIIGKTCKNVSTDQAIHYIAGYSICNDVTVRDWQARTPTWTLGKSFDTHGPLGPWIVTKDEIEDPHNLSIKTWVDSELRQNANTGEMIFNCFEQIAYLSQAMTLEPGDVITTGTPSGVGVKMKPRGYLKPGQKVRIEIEKIGFLENPVIAES